ncbi:MAG: hypothetical protein ACQEW9_00815 [Bacteroidota bacterium]
MKHLEAIKQMVRNVINGFVFLVLLGSSLVCEAQQRDRLTKEQYEVIEGAFRNSGKDQTRIFFQTIDYKSWVHLLYGDYYREDWGIALCSFEDSKLEQAIDQVIDHVINIKVKEFNPRKLGKRFVLVKDLTEQPYLSLTEPIIIGDYSFVLFKYPNSESLEVQKKNEKGEWVYECSIPLYVVFTD